MTLTTRARRTAAALMLTALTAGTLVGWALAHTQPAPRPTLTATPTTLWPTLGPAPAPATQAPAPATAAPATSAPTSPAPTSPAPTSTRCTLLYQPGLPTPATGRTCTQPDGSQWTTTSHACADGTEHVLYTTPDGSLILTGRPGLYLAQLPSPDAAAELLAACGGVA